MIWTVTFNPALDYAVYLDRFELGSTNRSVREELTCGGKGINVSVVLRELGVETRALGFLAGFTGEAIRTLLAERGVPSDFITLPDGVSRINVKLKHRGETEVNARGPDVPPAALESLLAKLDHIPAGDVLVLAGSIPATLPSNLYECILARMGRKDILTVVDASGPLLLHVLEYGPFLIKPNHEELAAVCGVSLTPGDVPAIRACARRLQDRGARNVLVSMAADGALLVTEDGQTLRQSSVRRPVVNSVGAGDSMVAAFLAGWLETGDYAAALRLGTAAGAATTFSAGLAQRSEIDAMLRDLPPADNTYR